MTKRPATVEPRKGSPSAAVKASRETRAYPSFGQRGTGPGLALLPWKAGPPGAGDAGGASAVADVPTVTAVPAVGLSCRQEGQIVPPRSLWAGRVESDAERRSPPRALAGGARLPLPLGDLSSMHGSSVT